MLVWEKYAPVREDIIAIVEKQQLHMDDCDPGLEMNVEDFSQFMRLKLTLEKMRMFHLTHPV